MPDHTTTVPGYQKYVLPALLLGVLLSPGAWLIVNLPPVPVSQAFHLATAGAALLASATGTLMLASLDRRLLAGLAGILGVVVTSWVAAGDMFAAVFYDLYASAIHVMVASGFRTLVSSSWCPMQGWHS
ncbi:MAG: hypothetical protein M1617_04345 [Actinobacteria bacterium]|nr:hypothetical protein [Actinomycetota bacterium]